MPATVDGGRGAAEEPSPTSAAASAWVPKSAPESGPESAWVSAPGSAQTSESASGSSAAAEPDSAWTDFPESAQQSPAGTGAPGLSLIDLALGAGSLAARVGMIPVRVAVKVARGPGSADAPTITSAITSADRSAAADASDGSGATDALGARPRRPVTDWSAWAVRSVAQVGGVERRRAHDAALALVSSATSAVATEPHLGRIVREIASAQLEPLIDQALPIVLDRLADDPVAVRRIVQDQSSGIMSEATDSARHTARQGDEAVDTLVNRILHRTPRTEAATGASAQANPAP